MRGSRKLTEQPELRVGKALAPGEPFLELADPRGWRVTLQLTESDIHRVKRGDRAIIQEGRPDDVCRDALLHGHALG